MQREIAAVMVGRVYALQRWMRGSNRRRGTEASSSTSETQPYLDHEHGDGSVKRAAFEP